MNVRIFVLGSILLLSACSGGSGSSASGGGYLPSSGSPISATVRYQPATITESLATPGMQFVYVDASSHNGTYPSDTDFTNWFIAQNSGFDTGSCATTAVISHALIGTGAGAPGQQPGPTMVLSFYPKTVGTCTENIVLSGTNVPVNVTVTR